jgi:hypothetical protein
MDKKANWHITGRNCHELLGKIRPNIQADEIWAFIGKKERHLTPEESFWMQKITQL